MFKFKKQALKLQQLMIGKEIEEFLKAKKSKKMDELLHSEEYYLKLAHVWDYLDKSILYLDSADRVACKNKKPFDN